jgi:hypothetical protein
VDDVMAVLELFDTRYWISGAGSRIAGRRARIPVQLDAANPNFGAGFGFNDLSRMTKEFSARAGWESR